MASAHWQVVRTHEEHAAVLAFAKTVHGEDATIPPLGQAKFAAYLKKTDDPENPFEILAYMSLRTRPEVNVAIKRDIDLMSCNRLCQSLREWARIEGLHNAHVVLDDFSPMLKPIRRALRNVAGKVRFWLCSDTLWEE